MFNTEDFRIKYSTFINFVNIGTVKAVISLGQEIKFSGTFYISRQIRLKYGIRNVNAVQWIKFWFCKSQCNKTRTAVRDER
jgi:hypothetical protein